MVSYDGRYWMLDAGYWVEEFIELIVFIELIELIDQSEPSELNQLNSLPYTLNLTPNTRCFILFQSAIRNLQSTIETPSAYPSWRVMENT